MPLLVLQCVVALSLAALAEGPESELRDWDLQPLLSYTKRMDAVQGEAVGRNGMPGAFFAIAKELLRRGTAQDFIALTNEPEPVPRIMGAYCLIQEDREKHRQLVQKLTTDQRKVLWLPAGCAAREAPAGAIIQLMLDHPDVLMISYRGTRTIPSPTPVTPQAAQ